MQKSNRKVSAALFSAMILFDMINLVNDKVAFLEVLLVVLLE